MPRGDGTGPAGAGKGTGIGGGGRMGGPSSAGPQGYCVCPECGTKVKHNRAEPCNAIKCPKCGNAMARS